jgi:hypothetical protein
MVEDEMIAAIIGATLAAHGKTIADIPRTIDLYRACLKALKAQLPPYIEEQRR